jgi:hypothetical protein
MLELQAFIQFHQIDAKEGLAERVGFEPIVQFAVNMALSSNAGIADRTSFAPATTFPERNERKQNSNENRVAGSSPSSSLLAS